MGKAGEDPPVVGIREEICGAISIEHGAAGVQPTPGAGVADHQGEIPVFRRDDGCAHCDESVPAVLHRFDGVQTDGAIRSEHDVTFPAAADAGDAAGRQRRDQRSQEGGADRRGCGCKRRRS